MIAAALEDMEWHLDADLAIVRLAKTEPEFTADELRKILRPAPNPNWVGLAFGRASRNGLIEPVAYQTSTSKTRRHGSLKVWRRKTEGAEQ